jgi:hypothetical protein
MGTFCKHEEWTPERIVCPGCRRGFSVKPPPESYAVSNELRAMVESGAVQATGALADLLAPVQLIAPERLRYVPDYALLPAFVPAKPRESEADRMRRFFFPPERLPSMAPPAVAAVPKFAVGDRVYIATHDGVWQVMQVKAHQRYALAGETRVGAVRLWSVGEPEMVPA